MAASDTLGSLLDTFLLRRPEARAAGYPASGVSRMRDLSRAGRERARVADDIVEAHPGSALSLYREAGLIHLAAFVASREGEAPPEPLVAADVIERFRAIELDVAPPFGRAKLDAFLADLAAPDVLATERVDVPRAVALGYDGRAVVAWLGGLVEPRSVPEIKLTRLVRIGGAGLITVALLAWLISGMVSQENLALHKVVAVSGVHPRAVSPPAGLTDGIKSGPYGVHTAFADAPWVQVDLGAVYAIDTVKIYNRGDGWFDEGLPMVLQLSETGATFVDVETRTATFGQTMPWVAKLGGKPGRFVRVRGAKGRYVTLTELEVFGRPK